jgi:pimeloyl-ACP methyl ester carboxylesterase
MSSPAMIASTQGVRVALHDLGGPDDPTAPVLLFAHATGFCGQVWEPTAAPLTDRYRCLAIDLRGHGVSETPDGGQPALVSHGRRRPGRARQRPHRR